MAENVSLYRERMLDNGVDRIAFSGKPDLYMDMNYNTIISENCCAMGMCGKSSCGCSNNK
ncbi:MAG: hypothetical protein KAJ56_02655 [Candidatus Aenigmarchaeota archaeon]|nr:hypothetical protein [Candidatus Aenigmarchaeota archaeon]